ncbi:uncharacterized protein BBA_00762 [Beauveria bassiana ARSEF 2860]|uniref:Uncharacterized protein n=1 Tax=Beauveria bassiana (strain ARSEF 2860) TaxID=655819 RepID=J5K001_BEAB2|nr:uncharacterized protein BBA_00762 [Beauveria bassiana ARSEF 2860]EJP69893.1 hypothetical protein BBA_00762 [Beauveria bassiana ARSEF 2860]
MPPTDSAQSSLPKTCPSDPCAESNHQETACQVEVVNESDIYRFVEIETCPDHSGSNEESPRPSLQSTADMYSWSLNDVSSTMNESKVKGSDSQDSAQSEILHMRGHQHPKSQPLTPPGLRHRLLKKFRPKRPWEATHDHRQDCAANLAASLGPVEQLRRRDRESTQIYTSSDDEDADSRSEAAKRGKSLTREDPASTANASEKASGA